MKESTLLCVFTTVSSTVTDFLIFLMHKKSLLHKYSPLLALVSSVIVGIRAAREKAIAVVELACHCWKKDDRRRRR